MAHTLLSDPQEVIGKRWRSEQSSEQARILGLARDALLFVSATGQRYRFEDFRKSLAAGARSSVGTFPASKLRASDTSEQPQDDLARLEELLRRTEGFFTKLRDEADSAGEKEQIQVILDVLLFISSTGQHRDFGEYLEHVEAGAPPYVIASFDTQEAADAWLGNHPNPPVSANVLIANNYHDVIHDRETGIRRLARNRDLEYHLAELARKKSPVAVASFASREEAHVWLNAQSEPARWAWVSIASELYLAAYHPNIRHRVLHPLSMAKGYELDSDEPQGSK